MSRKLLDYVVLTALEASDDRHQSRYYLINSVGRDARFQVSTFDFALLSSFDSPRPNICPQIKYNATIFPRHHKYKYNGQPRIDVFGVSFYKRCTPTGSASRSQQQAQSYRAPDIASRVLSILLLRFLGRVDAPGGSGRRRVRALVLFFGGAARAAGVRGLPENHGIEERRCEY